MNYETKTLPSGIIIENRPSGNYKYAWYIKNTWIVHNEGEPAMEYSNRNKSWYQHDKYHRLDGPAYEEANSYKRYYINDVSYEEEEYWNHPDVLAFKYLKKHPELKAFV